MDDGPAGEVEGAEVTRPEEASAPHPVSHRRIHEHRPQRQEHQVARELHPLRERAGDEGRRDDGEHELEGHERLGRNGRSVRGRRGAHPGQPCEAKGPDDAALVGPKGEGVPDQHPQDADHGQRDERLHHGGQDVLRPDQSAVEERQARGHEHDQGGRREHPGGIAGVDSVRHSYLLRELSVEGEF